MRIFAANLFVGLTIALLSSHASLGALRETAPTQLPRNVRPTHYDVAITPDVDTLSFTGKASIAVEVLATTRSITLNAADLDFESAQLIEGNGSAGTSARTQRAQIAVNTAKQTATFSFERALAPGAYTLTTEYRGKINTQANGLFAIDYATPKGRKRALFTQFEAPDARRMLPCWDEPAYKATFTLEATVPVEHMAVSNMPVAQRKDIPGGRALVRFDKSPVMSTYLLFFASGEFDRAAARVGQTDVGVITQRGLTSQAAFVLQTSQTVLREFNDYFGIPYPLPKLDNIAAPGSSQFFSAMENWGAILTFEHRMLLDPAIATESDKQAAFNTAAHEIAHQWFGNIVTMAWWDDLWLNEGFATWMASRMSAKLNPQWDMALTNVERRESAIVRDSLSTTHPVVQKIETVEQLGQAFDAITYQKGAAVIRMLEGFVGPEAWRAGVRAYIKEHAYDNAVSADLWRAIEAAAKQPINDIARDFTLQPGVPLVRITEASCDGSKTLLRLKQDEFSRDAPGKQPLEWRVPVIMQTPGHPAVQTLVTNGQAHVYVPGCGATVVNAGQTGYYRTLYSPSHFEKIKNAYGSLMPVDQLGVFHDAWSLGLNGNQSSSDMLELAAAMPVQSNPKLWGAAISMFDELNDYYEGLQGQKRLQQFAIAKLKPVLERVGWQAKPGEADTIPILRNQLLAALGEFGDAAVIAEARRRYDASTRDPHQLPGPLRKTILGIVAHHADKQAWERLLASARAEKTPLVRDTYYSLLASTQDASLTRRALDLSLTNEPGATTSPQMIARVAEIHPDLAFDFAVSNLKKVNEMVDVSSRSQFFPSLAARSADAQMIKKLRAYSTAHLPTEARREADTAAARIAYRIKIRNERLPEIDQWLEKKLVR